jgi:aspartate aminotransferase/aminotransferase
LKHKALRKLKNLLKLKKNKKRNLEMPGIRDEKINQNFLRGSQASKEMDPIMAINARIKQMQLDAKLTDPVLISAHMGKPTHQVNNVLTEAALAYWTSILFQDQLEPLAREVKSLTNQLDSRPLQKLMKVIQKAQDFPSESPAIDYCHPQGDLNARQIAAKGFTSWYKTKVLPKDIIFTVGGSSGLYATFEAINCLCPNRPTNQKDKRAVIITSAPFYPLHKGHNQQNNLKTIEITDATNFQLTAEAVQAKILELEQASTPADAIIICDPNNPLGTTLDKREVIQIANVLRNHPNIKIILDEAYAEMCFTGEHHSFLRHAPDLKNRMIILRSATKGMSAAGERMAAIMAFDPIIANQIVSAHCNITGHAPRSGQRSYAAAIESISKKNDTTLSELTSFYQPKLNLVLAQLKQMKALPGKNYKPDGTFYAIANLEALIGTPSEAGVLIETDTDIANYLLSQYYISLAPLSIMGLDEKKGWLRITCSDSTENLICLMKRIKNALSIAGKYKKNPSQLFDLLTGRHRFIFSPGRESKRPPRQRKRKEGPESRSQPKKRENKETAPPNNNRQNSCFFSSPNSPSQRDPIVLEHDGKSHVIQ